MKAATTETHAETNPGNPLHGQRSVKFLMLAALIHG